jgi:RNA polymerase-binding transcription factor DksA
MRLSKKFLQDRLAHLTNKLTYTEEVFKKGNLPQKHLEYKAQEHIPDIQSAIMRIKNGTYGFCLDCEEGIAWRRLVKMPHVSRCIKCQSEKEK